MPGIKRKASRASPYEPVSKLTKQRTSTTVKPVREKSTIRPPLPLPKWPSLKRKTTKESASPGGSGDASPPPGLRRAPTLTLEDKEPESASPLSGKKSLSKKGSVVVGEVVTAPSLPKTASIVEGDDRVTTLTRLASGSTVGRTTSFSEAPAAISKELSKTSTSTKTPLICKSISRGGSIVIGGGDVPSLSKSSSKSKSSKAGSETGVALEKVLSLSKSLSKPSLTKEKSASLISAAAEEAAAAAADDDEDGDGAVVVDIPLPPGGLMEIVFSFDTTGSMMRCLEQVRSQIQDMVQRLQADIPGIRIAIFAHGDYCDASNYVVQWIDFGASTPEICKFIRDVKPTGGGDFPEAYEVVLRRCQSVLSWTPGSQRSLVMIGDATPHEADDPQNEENIDWKTECRALRDMGVRIYGVQTGGITDADEFWGQMARITLGRHLLLDQFSNIFDMIMAICYRERGADLLGAYEDEVRGRHGGGAINKDLEGLFGTLRDESDPPSLTLSPSLMKIPTETLLGAKTGSSKVTALKKLKAMVKAKGAAKKVKGAGKTKPKAKTEKKKGGAKKTKKPKTKAKAKKSEKFLRETVDDEKFIRRFNDNDDKDDLVMNMGWTDWKRAIYPLKHKPHYPLPESVRDNRRVFRGANGYVRSDLFQRKHDVQAIYELGVRPPIHRKRIYTTLFKFTKGFKNKQVWDSFLLRKKSAFDAVSSNVARGAQIYVRRAVYPPDNVFFLETVNRINAIFDYAWNKPTKAAENFRTIERSNFLISGVQKIRNTPKKTTPKKAVPSKGKRASKETKAAAVKKSKTKTKTTKAAAKKAKPTKKTKTPAKKSKPTKKTKTPTKKARGKGKKAAK
ncbi:uncharacterized protein LOC124116601 [Haliotis rufescens]|uniref:uncharacterized protein LOC124116601 n=1 Tax=Haliotis rufescens TaxID=6454 RepID=UPI00201F67A0|nr:uncharacterized protein LOC124116601 [Haliotis rufescens]XP_046333955.2 uncharacterized protein LOC124116601 [Haliotis rufescens]XP_046333956.2 uncharacterized protein LOC124116601 [Haliotis rufescens]